MILTMTGEEMERAIEFILKNQSSYESRFDHLTQQIAETNKVLQMHAGTQTELIQIAIRNTEEQRQLNAEFRAGLRELTAAQARTDEQLKQTNELLKRTDEQLKQTNESLQHLAEAQTRTDERSNQTNDNLNLLAETVRRFVEGRG
jgi:chromosome segregation ATPase